MLKLTTTYGSEVNPTIKGNKFEFTYTPQHEDDFPCLVHSGRVGEEEITFLQLEEGKEATGWVQNLSEASQLKKIWDGLHGISAEMTNEIEGLSARIQIDMDGLMTEFKDHKNDTSTLIAQTENQLRLEAKDSINHAIQVTVPGMIRQQINSTNYKSIFQQQSDNILLAIKDKLPKMTGREIVSAINLSTGGVRIKGETISLDGNTYMTNAFARKLMVDELYASDVQAFTAKFNSVIAGNLDVNNLTGNKATFVQALFNGVHSRLRITGDAIDIVDSNGRSATKFDDSGLKFYKNGIYLGQIALATNLSADNANSIHHNTNSISIVPRRNAHFSIGAFKNGYNNPAVRTFSVSGETGTIVMSGDIKGSETQNGALQIVTYGDSIEIHHSTRSDIGLRIDSKGLYFKYSDYGWAKVRS